MKFTDMPKIFGADTRKVEECSAADLQNAGQVFTSYGINVGETVEIPSNRNEIVVVRQPNRQVTANGERTFQYFMSINKNGKATWLSLGSLVRRDANQEPVDEVSKAMLEYDNIESRIQACLGKKITCKGRENRIQPEFVNRVRTGNTVEKPTNIYAWA